MFEDQESDPPQLKSKPSQSEIVQIRINSFNTSLKLPHPQTTPRLPLACPPPQHLQPFQPHASLLSPDGSLKRLHSATSPNFLGPKRKRGRPRRLSGSEAVPLALSLGEQELEEPRTGETRSRSSPLPGDISESEQSPIKSLKDGSGALSLSPGGKFLILD